MVDNHSHKAAKPAPDARSSRALPEAAVSAWDAEADVLVVGTGAAGLCAGIEAANAGSRVLALERAGGTGGTTAVSDGMIYLGGGTAVQEATGHADSAEEMYKYLVAVTEDPELDKIRAYCEGSVEHYDWIVAQGVPFKPTFYYGVSGEPPTDDGLVCRAPSAATRTATSRSPRRAATCRSTRTRPATC